MGEVVVIVFGRSPLEEVIAMAFCCPPEEVFTAASLLGKCPLWIFVPCTLPVLIACLTESEAGSVGR